MKSILACLAVTMIVAGLSTGTAVAAQGIKGDPGRLSCNKVLTARLQAPYSYQMLLGYTRGYLRAAKQFGTVRHLPRRDAEGFLFEHCYGNPTDTLNDALTAYLQPVRRVAAR